jgi:hypothetical protein
MKEHLAGTALAFASVAVCASPAAGATSLRFDPFQAYGAGGASPRSIVTGDFNLDGKLDMAIGNLGAGSNPPGNLVIRLGKANGSFGPPASHTLPGGMSSLVVGDFDANGDPDLAASASGAIAVWLGGTGASFSAPMSYSTGGINATVLSGQFDAPDTDPDLAVIGADPMVQSRAAVLLGGTGGTFGSATSYPFLTAMAAGGLGGAAADFNGDGDPDIAETDIDSPGVNVIPGAAGGTFGGAVSTVLDEGGESLYVDTGFFNGDSDPDLVLDSFDGDVVVVLGSTGATFATPVTDIPLANADSYGLATGDFVGDENTDIAAAEQKVDDGPSGIAILTGRGDGSFASPKVYGSAGVPGRALATDDFNGDGHPDFAMAAPADDKVEVLLSDYSQPKTRFTKKPPNTVGSSSVIYRFASNEAHSTFQCKLDDSGFKSCQSPRRLKHLRKGEHTFKVRATDSAGNTDSSPATDSFKVK